MQQLQREALLVQLLVYPVPVGHGTGLAARNGRRLGEEQSIEGGLVEVFGQRPLQSSVFGPAEIVGYGAAGDIAAPSDLTVAQSSRPFEAEDFSDFAHGYSLCRHRSLRLLVEVDDSPSVEGISSVAMPGRRALRIEGGH